MSSGEFESFWVLDWIEEKEVRSLRDAALLLREKKQRRAIRDRARACILNPGQEPSTTSAIMAGAGLDLSGHVGPQAGPDLITAVDRAFGSVWHYFDELVVEGLSARRFTRMIEDRKSKLAFAHFEAHVELMLHLKSIGALSSMVFRQKPSPCAHHGDRELLEEAGLAAISSAARAVVEEIAREGVLLDYQTCDSWYNLAKSEWASYSHIHYRFSHPLFGEEVGEVSGNTPNEEMPDSVEEIKSMVASHLVDQHIGLIASDASAAKELSVPLAVTLPVQQQIRSRQLSPASVDDVALELGLPILDGISARDLIKIRADEQQSFERFRSALKEAIQERLRASQAIDSMQIASEIVSDVLSPALADIEQRLKVAKGTLAKKSGANIAVGAALVVAGLTAGMPILLPAGVALAGTTVGAHLARFFDDKGSVELSDMYFLWRLQEGRIRNSIEVLP